MMCFSSPVPCHIVLCPSPNSPVLLHRWAETLSLGVNTPDVPHINMTRKGHLFCTYIFYEMIYVGHLDFREYMNIYFSFLALHSSKVKQWLIACLRLFTAWAYFFLIYISMPHIFNTMQINSHPKYTDKPTTAFFFHLTVYTTNVDFGHFIFSRSITFVPQKLISDWLTLISTQLIGCLL